MALLGLALAVGVFAPWHEVRAAGWYSPAWTYRNRITINSSKVAGSATSFPVLINSTNYNWKFTAFGGHVLSATGSDFVVTAGDGTTKLDYEVESYASSTGALVAWARIPFLSSTSNTVLYIYYGNAAASNQQNKTGVWDSNFAGVWHMTTTSSQTTISYDSTANSNTGTKFATNQPFSSTAGTIDGAQDFNAAGGSVNVGNSASLELNTGGTIAGWIYPRSDGISSSFGRIVDKSIDADGTNGYALQMGGLGACSDTGNGNRLCMELNSSTYIPTTNNSVPFNQWTHFAWTFDGTAWNIYINGTLDTPYVQSALPPNVIGDVYIGNRADNTVSTFDGIIDDVQISNTARSASWIQTEYDNQKSPSTFYSVNPEELGLGIQVSSRSDVLSDSRPSATSNHTIAFTTNTAVYGSSVSNSSTVLLILPSGFTMPSNMNCGDVDAATSSQFNFNYPGCAATATAWGFSVAGQVATLTAPTDTAVHVVTGTPITIKIGSNATYQQTGTHWITNPSSAGVYTISVGGRFGGSGNIPVQVGYFSGINFVQGTAGNDGGSGNSFSLNFPNNTQGDTIIVGVGWQDTSYNMTISDTAGNTYQSAIGPVNCNNYGVRNQIFYASNIKSSAGTNTVTVSSPSWGGGQIRMTIEEWSGLAAVNALDQTAGSTDTNQGGTMDSGPVTTTNANELLYGLGRAQNDGTNTAGPGYTLREFDGQRLASESRIVSAAGTYSATMTASDSGWWTMLLATFKAKSAPAQTVAVTVAENLSFTVNSVATGASFPRTGILDNFNRADEDPLNNGHWNGQVYTIDIPLRLYSSAADPHGGLADSYWSSSKFGPDSEAYTTVTTKPSNTYCIGVICKIANPNSSSFNAYWGEYCTQVGTDTWHIDKFTNNANSALSMSGSDVELNAGDSIGLECTPGSQKLKRKSGGVWTDVKTSTDTSYDNVSGYIGLHIENTGVADDFGGGTINCPADDGATVNAIATTATSIPFGSINSNTFYQGCQDLTVSTNALGGYSLTVQEKYAMQTVNGLYSIPDTTCDAANFCSVATATTWMTPTNYGLGHTCVNVSGSDCNASFLNGAKFKPLPNITAGTGPGTPQFVQGNGGAGDVNIVTTFQVSFNLPNIPGNAIIVSGGFNSCSDTSPPSSVTDSAGNTYNLVRGPDCDGTAYLIKTWVACNIKSAASNTVTLNMTGGERYPDLVIHEYSGLAAGCPTDGSSAAYASSGTTVTSGPFTTTAGGDLLYGFAVGETNNLTAGAGWTKRESPTGDISEDMTSNSAGPYVATWTGDVSSIWVAHAVAFKAASVNPMTTLMSNSGPVASSTSRAKYRLAVAPSQTAGTYTTVITYTILGTF